MSPFGEGKTSIDSLPLQLPSRTDGSVLGPSHSGLTLKLHNELLILLTDETRQ